MSKPREWWIYPQVSNSSLVEVLNYDPLPVKQSTKPYLHVIEKSAFDDVVKERDEARAKLKEFDEYYTFQNLERVEQERDDLKAQLAKAKKNTDGWGADAQSARRQIERLERALAYAKNSLWKMAAPYAEETAAEIERLVMESKE